MNNTDKRYTLTDETIQHLGRTLHRIKALKSFGNVSAGELGGYIENEANLSQIGNSWVSCNAVVYDNAQVCDNAQVWDNARVYGGARVYGDARVCANARIYGGARVYGNAWVYGNAQVGNARVYGNARICGGAEITLTLHYLQIGQIGSRNDTTTFYRDKDNNPLVVCGCFTGTIDEFEAAVKAKHSGNPHEDEYLAAIALARIRAKRWVTAQEQPLT